LRVSSFRIHAYGGNRRTLRAAFCCVTTLTLCCVLPFAADMAPYERAAVRRNTPVLHNLCILTPLPLFLLSGSIRILFTTVSGLCLRGSRLACSSSPVVCIRGARSAGVINAFIVLDYLLGGVKSHAGLTAKAPRASAGLAIRLPLAHTAARQACCLHLAYYWRGTASRDALAFSRRCAAVLLLYGICGIANISIFCCCCLLPSWATTVDGRAVKLFEPLDGAGGGNRRRNGRAGGGVSLRKTATGQQTALLPHAPSLGWQPANATAVHL